MRNAISRRRVATGLAVAATTGAMLCMSTTAAHASLGPATAPNGGVFNIFTEAGNFTANPANAITGGGFWGHEGANRAVSGTFISADGTDGGAAINAAFNITDPSVQTVVAFVPTSADGSAESPAVTSGELAGQAFQWFTTASIGSAFTGNTNPVLDSVENVSTQTQWNDWVAAGKPVQGFENLVMHDTLAAGDPVSAHPQASSIMNTWPAGTKISMVVAATNGFDANGEPILAVGANGHAITAWMPFTTVQSPDTAAATSAGYQLAAVQKNVTLTASPASPVNAGTSVTFTATVSPAAAGETVTFMDGTNTLGTGTTDATGKATFTTSSLSAATHSITAVDSGSTSPAISFVVNGNPTTTALSVPANVTAGTASTVSVQTGPTGTAGSVTLTDNGSAVGSPVTVNASGVATFSWNPAVGGSHTLSATFTPTTTGFAPSTSTQTVSVATPAGTASADGTIAADIASGQIQISTPYTATNPLNVGTLTLNSAATEYSGSAAFNGITVSDTRAGALPWTVTALATALSAGTSTPINAQNVGLTGLAATSNTSSGTITTTDNPAASPAVASAATGSAGLGGTTPHTVLHNTGGLGTSVYHGTLTIKAPASTLSGHYTGTVTFTVS